MNFIKAINSISSQWWAGYLLASGVVTIWLANFAHTQTVASALATGGTGMVAGAMVLFQHQPKAESDTGETTTLTETKEK